MKIGRMHDRGMVAPWLVLTLCLILPSGAAGCEFDSTTNPAGSGMLGCRLDLRIYHIQYDLEPGPIITPGVLYHDQPFDILWSFIYDGDNEDISNEEFPYTTRIEIFKNDELFFEVEVETGPVKVKEYGTERYTMEDGLPPGNYEVKITADIDGVIPTCVFDLEAAFNNIETAELIVEAEPIDDIVESGDESPPSPGGFAQEANTIN